MKPKSFSSVAMLGVALTTPAICQNILNNGSFEYGMMCHNFFQSSHTGVDYTGDYRWYVSTDAHSGTYSAEIICTGSDCLRAQLTSNHIPIAAGRSYTLTVWSKCASGETAMSYIPQTVGGDT